MTDLREIATDALRYWERRRLIYNAVLAAIVIGVFIWALPDACRRLTPSSALSLVILAILANLLYCAAYVPDVFVQLSDFRHVWRRNRWLLFAVGLILAAALAFPASLVLFAMEQMD